ncbi:MAG: transposase, partial [Shimia sp.]|nr:transposase [Shimia sp.]
MFLRVTTVKRKGKTYTYGQLVESYRRPSDGVPTHRVIASLGALEPHEIDNWRTAMAASRQGKRVVVVAAPTTKTRKNAAPKPVANLQHLDIAVLLELWRSWELDSLLEELIPTGDSDISPASVIAALAIQRCVAAGSKLSCIRWLPQTALPELLELAPAKLNNTRMHRVLERLEGCESLLMSKLPRRYVEAEGAFNTLFLDVTDAWFVGHGPELAKRGKTKEGLIKRKIGIVLLCNEHGYPVRWDVVSGNSADNTVMSQMLDAISQLSWVGDAPLVCDRAMGHSAQLTQMLSAGLRFVTALTKTEYGSYCPALPSQSFDQLELPAAEDKAVELVAEHAGSLAKAHEVAPDGFLFDFGIVQRAAPETEREAPDETSHSPETEVEEDRGRRAMRLCQRLSEAVAGERFKSYNAAGRDLDMTLGQIKKYRQLDKLAPNIQRDVLAGKAAGRSL